MKKICVFGLGAIGGLIGARLAQAGYAVSAVARGATLAAVQRGGLVLEDAQGEHAIPLHVTVQPEELGPQDLLILSVKTCALAEIAAQVRPLIGARTTVLSAMNGIPWWFLHGLTQAPPGLQLHTVDPAARVSGAIAAAQVVGCVTHLSATAPAPGRVRQVAGNQLIVGEPTGGADSARARQLIGMLRQARFEVTPARSIQQDIWFKLWGNMTVNPVSFLTGATGDRILDDDYVRGFMSHCMREAAQIGARIGLPIDAAPEERHAVTRKLGAFKTSMLQDLEAGKPVELDALVGVVIELGRQVDVAMPHLETLLGLSRLKAQQLGLYPVA